VARSRRPAFALGAVLGLLCQTTAYGYILAVGWLLDRRLRRGEVAPLPRTEAAAGFALALSGAIAGLVQLMPQPGTSFAPGWRFGWDPTHASEVLRMPWRAFVPLPRPELHFSSTNLLDAWPGLQTVLGLLTLGLAVAVLWRREVALTTFSNGAAIAELIRSEGLDRYPLLAYREPPAATVVLALGRPLYVPSRGVFTTYPDWGPEQRELSLQEVRCAARELAQREGEDIVLVMNQELPPWEELVAAGARLGAIQGSEDYHLYRLRHDSLERTAQAAGCGSEVTTGGRSGSDSG
jgi:hypothetical protein